MQTLTIFSRIFSLCLMLCLSVTEALSQEPPLLAGVASIDITPDLPIRLSGYASRSEEASGVDDPLKARALAILPAGRERMVLVSIDTIGLSAELTDRVLDKCRDRFGLERRQVVLSGTHSHTAPQLTGTLVNLFDQPLSPEEKKRVDRYSDRLVESIITVIGEAIQKVTPCTMESGEGMASVAKNRRTKPGEPEGPVDRSVRVLRVRDTNGKILGVVYQYACHCTSIPPERNRVSGDWAGISASLIERSFPDCIAMPVIGCGADANPVLRGNYEAAIQNGAEIASAVHEVLKGEMKALPQPDKLSFSYVALAFDRPKRDQLETLLKSSLNQEKFFASSMLEVWKRKGRIPESYPAPVHLWRFGDELTWVFLGGEVVVDYQLRLGKEMTGTKKVWVASYCDDVFAYVASERLRREGGYEVDRSMLYYNRPGRWETGTEDFLVGRINDLARKDRELDQPLPPESALKSLSVSKGFQVDLVSHEPAVQDPINIAFDSRGRVWVVEMGDYPRGGKTKGKIKILEDRDGDGRFEHSKIFLDDLDFPTGVFPWKDGAIVAAVPDVFWARDTDGDDIPERREILVTGFAAANPQHRVHGFTYGLDHRLYFGSGDGTRQVVTPRDGKTWTISGSDLSIDVEGGDLKLHSGKTQFIRGRDDWGNWFGNDNVHPMFHYVVDRDRDGSSRRLEGPRNHHLLRPATAPPIYPLTRNLDRFNDLHTLNRFTSSCSSIVCRDPSLGEGMLGAGIICEPVHNMVARIQMVSTGASYRGVRFSGEESSEWLRSTDPWFRPVRAENGPDGSIWIVDMYRRVIEHPEWIPEEWQARVDLRAGEGMGRIYRIRSDRMPVDSPIDFRDQRTSTWIERLSHPNGPLRDLAQRELLFRNDLTVLPELKRIVRDESNPLAQLHAFAILRGMKQLEKGEWEIMLRSNESRLVKQAICWGVEDQQLSEQQIFSLLKRKETLLSSELSFEILQYFVAMNSPSSVSAIAILLKRFGEDEWFRRLASTIESKRMDGVVGQLLQEGELLNGSSASNSNDLLLASLLPSTSESYRIQILGELAGAGRTRPAWHYVLATGLKRNEKGGLSVEVFRDLLEDGRRELEGGRIASATQMAALQLIVSQVGEEGISDGSKRDLALLVGILGQSEDRKVLALVLRGLQNFRNPDIANDLLKRWGSWSPQVRSVLVGTLVESKEWLPSLIVALEKNQLTLEDLDPLAIDQLRLVSDGALKERTERLLKQSTSPANELIEAYLKGLPSEGNAAAGEKIFERHCALCHSTKNDARPIGPDLAPFRSWTNLMWLTAILDPNRAVEPRYRRLSIVTEDDQVLVGLLQNETDGEVTIVTPDGKVLSMKKASLQSIQVSERSLMPEGFSQFLKPSDMNDLILYLRKNQ